MSTFRVEYVTIPEKDYRFKITLKETSQVQAAVITKELTFAPEEGAREEFIEVFEVFKPECFITHHCLSWAYWVFDFETDIEPQMRLNQLRHESRLGAIFRFEEAQALHAMRLTLKPDIDASALVLTGINKTLYCTKPGCLDDYFRFQEIWAVFNQAKLSTHRHLECTNIRPDMVIPYWTKPLPWVLATASSNATELNADERRFLRRLILGYPFEWMLQAIEG